MSADLLRRAAALMRERASEAEQPGYGSDSPDQPWCPNWTYTAVRHVERNVDIECDKHSDGDGCNTWGRYAGYHIAGMTPAIALAVADWLDKEAALTIEYDSFLALVADGKARVQSSKSSFPEALAVARAYLGEQS